MAMSRGSGSRRVKRSLLEKSLWPALALALVLPPAVAAAPGGSNDERPGRRQVAGGCPTHGELFEPADGKTLLIVGQDRDSTEEYVEAVGVVPGGFMTYSHVNGPVLGLHYPINFGGTSHGQHFVDKYPNTVMQVGLGMDPETVNLGLADVQLEVLGDWIKAAQRPVFLRIGYEFDHPQHANEPDAFIAAWRRIVDSLRAQGVTNAAYTWVSAGFATYKNLPLSAWYPGDDYVDWVGLSVFWQGYASNAQSLVFANKMADLGEAHGKTVMLSETTPYGANTATADPDALWADWHQNVIDFIEARDVKAWSYINQNWEAVGWGGFGDSRVQNNPVLQDLWLTEISRDRYLQQSDKLFCRLGYAG